jgi:hypothetical protein
MLWPVYVRRAVERAMTVRADCHAAVGDVRAGGGGSGRGGLMRVGTWNLAGRWSEEHHQLLREADCDIWLLTEVNERTEIDAYWRHLGTSLMAARRRWAGVYSRVPLVALPDPHPASATAMVDGTSCCSTILPWRSCGTRPPWVGVLHADKTAAALDDLLRVLPPDNLVWGGDWNHALSGREYSGSVGGRRHVLNAVERLNLQIPTAELPHRIDALLSIDHIAVGRNQAVRGAQRIPAQGMSDHDAYVVELEPADARQGEST